MREKLRVAKAMMENPELSEEEKALFTINVSALEQVQPKDLDASEIDVRIGTTWIEKEDYERFIYELLGTPRRAQAVQLDIDFIKDIGSLSGLSDLEFNTETCTVEEIGYTKGTVPLTGVYKPHEYGDVILPLTVIRRFDCILSDTKDAVLKKYDEVKNLPMKDVLLRKASKFDFYNTSKYTFERLMDDPDHIEDNFRDYLNGFSENVQNILEKFKFDGHITTMANKGILYIVLKEFTTDRGNLHPDEISNLEMGYIFEEIIRRFSESHNEDAGQHYTPREVIQLMVNILFNDDNDILSGNNVAKTIYDEAVA